LPLAAGKFLRSFVEDWANRNRSRLTLLSSLALLSIPWMKISESSESLGQVALSGLLVLVVSGLVIHAIYLLINDGACRLFRFPAGVRKAVVILASQKTLPVAMAILAFLPESAISPETKGLLAIPCITSHLGQIFMDAVIATRWGRGAD
jgi:sodium/bile acid cotransporter 7